MALRQTLTVDAPWAESCLPESEQALGRRPRLAARLQTAFPTGRSALDAALAGFAPEITFSIAAYYAGRGPALVDAVPADVLARLDRRLAKVIRCVAVAEK